LVQPSSLSGGESGRVNYGVCRFSDCNILPKQMLTLWVDTEWLGPGR